ncbi:MAG: hypothetical protein ACO3JL_21415, partial [Myxococcota bacterium]
MSDAEDDAFDPNATEILDVVARRHEGNHAAAAPRSSFDPSETLPFPAPEDPRPTSPPSSAPAPSPAPWGPARPGPYHAGVAPAAPPA